MSELIKIILSREEIDFTCEQLNNRRNHLKAILRGKDLTEVIKIDQIIAKIRKLQEIETIHNTIREVPK